MVHLSEAQKVNDLVQDGGAELAGENARTEFTALVDRKGAVLAAQQEFLEECRRQWRDFDGRRLPDPVMRLLIGEKQGLFRGRSVTLRAR